MKNLFFALVLFVLTVAQAFSFTPVVAPSKMSGASSKTSLSAGPNIEVVSQPDKDFLEKKGVFSWGTWGCEASKFPWTYDSNESCYLLEGQVTVTPTDDRPPATFGKGDFVTFPAGMSCTWDVSVPVNKHFMFF
ncbi:Enzyme of the cupin superfamily [Seminavis robusta]|uniref:Enzyme of the cupin superfamily n=1 Tax=Seminavis robusta TaxID=568900 RepID=A0A9N8DQ13_9STRA|nr:Enzyme of the cupin superfamily [Seminavis robusta]|eukprot:Sro289_g109130.1 Enzyme of the cupin superfamily (134) ;mRNA; r:49506-49907